MALQEELESEQALLAYQRCLKEEPDCVECLYEIGWSYWQLGKWEDVILSWGKGLHLEPNHNLMKQYIAAARENLAMVRADKIPTAFHEKVALGTLSTPKDGPVSLLFAARRQSYNRTPSNPLDHYDPAIHSPKSVHFSKDGKKVYVNSLESNQTLVYDPMGLEKLSTIKHQFFGKTDFPIDPQPNFGYRFDRPAASFNKFSGKPVELTLTHGGKYLWVPYYRRNFDKNGALPSAVAVVDTTTDKIVRVMATGPISKYVKPSPDGHWMAISHWGDNTVGLVDIRSSDPLKFKAGPLLVVEEQLNVKKVGGDRDKNCGFCVRGLAFSQDSRYLFVSRMKGGGISAFDLSTAPQPKYLGTVFGILPGPRDLEVIKSDSSLMMSCNASGFVAKVPLATLIEALKKSPGKSIEVDRDQLQVKTAFVGLGARSIRLSPDEKYLFVSVNKTGELVALNTAAMHVETRIPVDSYPVGLDISPDGTQLWVTSQGRDLKGGNSIGIFQVRYRVQEAIRK